MRRFLILAALMFSFGSAAPAFAQPLPFEGPIRIISGYAPGGSSDTVARLVADKMQQSLKRPVLVENRTGAAGKIAAEAVKKAPHDGSQILLGNTVMMVLTPLTEKVDYDPLADFAPIARAGEYQIPLATGAMTHAKYFANLVTWLQNNPDKANYGVPAAGSLPHLYGLQFAKAIGVKMVMAPYRGGAPIANDLIGGQIAAGLSATADFVEQHEAGRLRIVALSGTRRMPTIPDVPTFGEVGLDGFDENGWNGFFAPADTPPDVIKRYNAAINEALTSADVALKLQNLGFLVSTSTPADLGKQLVRERDKWRPLLIEAGAMK
jgi:tripartite-type tricarboxylate transporter receptor subunit TctC